MDHSSFIAQLPEECQSISIEPRHKVALEHFLLMDGTAWVVLLTEMPEQSDMAWRMTKREYWGIQPKHELRDRWIRENLKPTIEGPQNKPKPRRPRQLLIF